MEFIMSKLLLIILAILPCANAANSGEVTAGKTLIVYYSLTGKTKAIAERMQAKTGADIFVIKTVKTYSPISDQAVTEERRRELANDDLPVLQSPPPDMAEYDLILVGSPVWWHLPPTPLMRFLLDADFAGKKVAAFCTYKTNLFQYHADFAQRVRNGVVQEGLSLSFPDRIPPVDLDATLDAWLKKIQ